MAWPGAVAVSNLSSHLPSPGPGMSACSPQMRPVTQQTTALSHGSQQARLNKGLSDEPKPLPEAINILIAINSE